MFNIGLGEGLLLAVLALVIFGPDQLPKAAGQAGRALRQLRNMANSAKQDLRDGLGPEFADLDIADLHPRTFIRKHLLDGMEDEPVTPSPYDQPPLSYGERPPYDTEAT